MRRRGLAEKLRPDALFLRVEDISPDWLAVRGIRAVLLDLDNTLTAWRSEELPQSKRHWVEELKKRFGVCLVSNTVFGGRLRRIGQRLGVPVVGRWGLGRKPGTGALRDAMRLLGAKPEETVMIGDQIFTDVLAGKRAGVMTILVEPVDRRREFFGTRLARLRERGLWERWRAEIGTRGEAEGSNELLG
ncbi:MAG: YqeG family HAD IIIA-type phosphatase [Armatimonadetes bacterium]|nr:YqeG family HAD IIIA-type phosphatase [Armatimonadota bacterium]